MNSQTNSTSIESTYSRNQRVRHQLQELFSCFFLKGKMTVSLTNAPQQIELILSLPESTNLFSQNKEVGLLFKFSTGYPEEPPALFLTSDLFPHQKSFIDVINEDNWDPSVTVTQITKNFIQVVQENGLKNTLDTIFNSNHKIQSSYRHIKEQNNISIQPKSTFHTFISPFSCFKPPEQSYSPAPEISTKPTYTPMKYKKKNNSDMKFYDISQNKHSDQSKGSEKGKKKQAKPMNKNANLPKFLIRIFIKYVDRFKELYIKKQYDKLQVQCRKMKDWKRHDKKQHAFGLKHLKRFFQDEEDGYPCPYLNRKVIMQIIQKYLLEQICENSQIPDTHRVGYLVACRVYSLRCRNSVLAGRIQSK